MNRCLIIGNGPSLADIPNSFLEKHHTFGGNRIYLKYEPDAYFYVDPVAHQQGWLQDIKALRSLKYIDAHQAHDFPGSIPLNCIHDKGFSFIPLKYVYAYFSVTTVMIQMAFHYGYKEVGLIGMDHRYNVDREPFVLYKSTGVDNNHFTPDYYPEGALWNIPHLDNLEQWHVIAKKAFDIAGRSIVNLTPNSALGVYHMVDWREWA